MVADEQEVGGPSAHDGKLDIQTNMVFRQRGSTQRLELAWRRRKNGLDATKPLNANDMKFKRIRVPGKDAVDPAKAVGPVPGRSWHNAIRV